ncbi:hypothetical protein [Spongiimicrobium sp. 3-5]|uniref:hypothetical protein n=1 Tax=Spongiimicrobium sp. 3-5 TaxID=3332596 RepID=UPI0039804609
MKNCTFLLVVMIGILSSVKAQNETAKDTLYFKYDDKYIQTYPELPGHNYLREYSYYSFYLGEREKLRGLKPSKVLNLKRFIRKSEFYRKGKGVNLDDEDFGNYLSKRIVFLVKKDTFIRVIPTLEIE